MKRVRRLCFALTLLSWAMGSATAQARGPGRHAVHGRGSERRGRAGVTFRSNGTVARSRTTRWRCRGSCALRGLDFSTSYKVTIRKGLALGDQQVTSDIVFYGRTPDREPEISLNPTSYILPVGERSLLPVTTVNVSELAVEVLRIDPRTLVQVSRSVLASGWVRHRQAQGSLRGACRPAQHLAGRQAQREPFVQPRLGGVGRRA